MDRKNTEVGILAIQLHSKSGNKDVNIKKVEYFVEKNSKRGLDIVVLPEFFSTGIDRKSFVENPEDVYGGETILKISEIAKRYRTNIVAGSVIEKENGKLYNTSFVINREGEIVNKYRKIHLYNYLGGTEGENITAGDEEVIVELDFGKVGLGICFDIRYPLHFKKLAKMGADIIVLPTAWVVPRDIYYDEQMLVNAQEMWIAMNKVRAYDNYVYFVSCNQTKDANDKISCIGNSMIVAPSSEVLAMAKNEETAIYARVELEAVKNYRRIYPISEID
ncbi:MAG: nitrilase-related carbon-nitrogen hydrolase [Candidatus Gastranaerophilaceae bacterium]